MHLMIRYVLNNVRFFDIYFLLYVSAGRFTVAVVNCAIMFYGIGWGISKVKAANKHAIEHKRAEKVYCSVSVAYLTFL